MNKTLAMKLISLALLALIILIPLKMVEFKISERAQARETARWSIASSWTGEQQIAGPIIAIPYDIKTLTHLKISNGFELDEQVKTVRRYRYITPEQLVVATVMDSEVRYRGIYKIPVYTNKIKLSGFFDSQPIRNNLQALKNSKDVTFVGQPRVLISIRDPRGLNSVSAMSWAKGELSLLPGAVLGRKTQGLHADLKNTQFATTGNIPFQLDLELRGMSVFEFMPMAKQVDVRLHANWPHPEFTGAFLPASRDINDQGFEANWQVNEFASNIQALLTRCELDSCDQEQSAVFGVRLIDPVDVYVQSERAVKYGLLFVSLIFVSFFMFEILRKLRIHPVHYLLVGAAKASFFLLLISLAEHTGFKIAYVLAVGACLLLIGLYLNVVLGALKSAVTFCSGLAFMYWLLYMILKSEDYALLMGALLCFSVLAILMLATRHVDWYRVGLPPPSQPQGSKPN